MSHDIGFDGLMGMAEELLALMVPNGFTRDIYFDMSKLTEECGEVAACLNKSAKTNDDLADELADVLVVCAVIAHKKGINLSDASVSKQKRRVKKLLDRFHNGHYPLRRDGEVG